MAVPLRCRISNNDEVTVTVISARELVQDVSTAGHMTGVLMRVRLVWARHFEQDCIYCATSPAGS